MPRLQWSARPSFPVIGEAVNELLDAERERHKSELVSATRGLAIAKLEAAAGALELALATERGKVLDLPNPLKRVKWAACRLWRVERKPSAR